MGKEPGKEIKTINDLPGIGPQAAEKLIGAGYKTLEAMAVASPMELIEAASLGQVTAEKAIKAARDALEMGFESADKLAEKRKLVGRITTGSKEVDALLGGGIETQSITEIYGKFASGKSQWCFQTAVTVQLPIEKGGLGGNCLYIDSENSFRPERVIQVANHLGMDTEKVLKNVFVARAYNSVLGNEPTCVLNDGEFHNLTMQEVVEERNQHEITAFAFNPKNGEIKPSKVTELISHEIGNENTLYKISTSFGREVSVTSAHSLFQGKRIGKRGKNTKRREMNNMRPESTYACLLKEGDHIAIPRKLNLEPKDIKKMDLRKSIAEKFPKEVLAELQGLENLEKDFIELKHTGKRKATKIPSTFTVDEELLWLLGLWIAEGSSQYKGRLVRFRLHSEEKFCKKAKEIIEKKFKVKSFLHKDKRTGGTTLLIPSRLLCLIFKFCLEMPLGKIANEKRVPEWIFNLPPRKIKHFIKGYWDGDGYHAKTRPERRIIFTTTSKMLVHDMALLFLRFGIVIGITKMSKRKKRHSQAYIIEAAGLSNNNVLELDKITQNLNACTWKDLAFARIRKIEKVRVPKNTKVYDFGVSSEGAAYHNFTAGFGGVLCHNTDHQMLLADKADEMIKQKKIKLIIVDSLMAQFRSEYVGRGTLANRQQKLNKHLRTLMKLAEMNNIAVLVTNQVMQRPDILFGDPTAPVGGEILAHASKTRLYLRKSKADTRVAKLVDSPSLPDGEAIFRVTENGLEDV